MHLRFASLVFLLPAIMAAPIQSPQGPAADSLIGDLLENAVDTVPSIIDILLTMQLRLASLVFFLLPVIMAAPIQSPQSPAADSLVSDLLIDTGVDIVVTTGDILGL
ncbi:hypothetical protein VF21_09637 [Pseudogymnoascus sp. 05NY08]|nr:hypothetical protein VF21_09637 [Pseudogymnoascus sp. 05NY08]